MKNKENKGIERNSMDPMEKKEIKRKLGGVGRIKKDKTKSKCTFFKMKVEVVLKQMKIYFCTL